MSPKKSKEKTVGFEQALMRLEKIVEELESGDLSLDESLARYEEGMRALRRCYKILQETEKRIEILLKGADGELKAKPFEPGSLEEQSETV